MHSYGECIKRLLQLQLINFREIANVNDFPLCRTMITCNSCINQLLSPEKLEQSLCARESINLFSLSVNQTGLNLLLLTDVYTTLFYLHLYSNVLQSYM